MLAAEKLIQQYYAAFNANDMQAFFDLLDDNIIHDINQGKSQTGKALFKKFMEHMNHCYQEKISQLEIMLNKDGTQAAAKFIVDGIYLATDSGFPEAKNQKYTVAAGTFFEIKNGKISRVTTYYNLPEWIEKVSQ